MIQKRTGVSRKWVLAAASAVLCLTLAIQAGPEPTKAAYGAKFEPADGKTLLIVGQDKTEMDSYVNLSTLDTPAGFMMYTSTQSKEGMTSYYRGTGSNDAGGHDFQYWQNNYPNSVMQIGLYMVDDLDNITAGTRDSNIDSLADTIKASNKPVFLRIGYEFDGSWNHYDPTKYKNAYKRIVDRFRAKTVNNVAFVWHSGNYGTFNNYAMADWYPGDTYVDWVGLSMFPGVTRSDDIATFASSHSKPLMIAEATPKADYEPSKGQYSWDNWYAPMFNFINNKGVKALSYINQDWNAQGMWLNQGWGNTRIQSNSTVQTNWTNTVQGTRYIRSSTSLFGAIGFKQSLPGKIEAEGWAAMSGVQAGPSDGGQVAGWIDTGDYMDFTVNVPTAGTYTLEYRISSPNSNTRIQFKIGTSTLAATTLPNTGDWNTYQTVNAGTVSLPAGSQTIRIYAETGGFNLNWFNVK